MFKPLTRATKTSHRPNPGFAETTFLHAAGDDDYSGFAPTEMSEFDDDALAERPSAEAARVAASTSHGALERAAWAVAPEPEPEPEPVQAVQEPSIPQSWVTSQWVAAQEAKAHEAANQARAVIAAQRRAEQVHAATDGPVLSAPKTGLARLRAAFERLLPGDFRSLLPLFIGVSLTMALISAVLPLIDRP